MEDYAFEVCVDSLESCENAVRGGATRIELCEGLVLGGITPSAGLINCAKKVAGEVPLYVLVRPWFGDFHYSSSDIDVMVDDIKNAYSMGADGIVTGALTISNQVDMENCERLRRAVEHIPMTFHRAFDLSVDPKLSLEDIIKLKFQRILTSGCKPTCLEGAALLKELIMQANDRISVVVAGGINDRNLQTILEKTNATEFHSSTLIKSKVSFNSVTLSEAFGPPYQVCNSDRVANLLSIAKGYWLH